MPDLGSDTSKSVGPEKFSSTSLGGKKQLIPIKQRISNQ
jgi:hypothetical protein